MSCSHGRDTSRFNKATEMVELDRATTLPFAAVRELVDL